jgi:hypothetical protein
VGPRIGGLLPAAGRARSVLRDRAPSRLLLLLLDPAALEGAAMHAGRNALRPREWSSMVASRQL